MSRIPHLLLIAAPLLLVGRPVSQIRAQEAQLFVSTTRDMVFDEAHCAAGEPCPLRSAIVKADRLQGVVRACYDPAEVGGGPGCPADAAPLRTSDPGYDPATGRWLFGMARNLLSYELITGTVTIDFTRDIAGWDGPEDNRIVIESTGEQNFAFAIQSDGNALSGFEVRGVFNVAAIELRIGASNNQLGPGLVLAGLTQGVGIRIRDARTTNNRIVGNWFGITGDGRQVSPVNDDCIRIHKGAHDNTVGGPDPGDRNVIAACAGAGVGFDDDDGLGTRANMVQGNWIGVDATGGKAVGSQSGVRISSQAHSMVIRGNAIGGNHGPGITVSDSTFGTVIEANVVGALPTGGQAAGNQDWGIRFQGRVKDSQIAHNVVANNRRGGVLISGALTRGIRVTENSITANGGPALEVAQGANSGLVQPRVFAASTTEVLGQACGGCTVEIFSDPAGQAAVFEGRVGTDVAFGQFRFLIPAGLTHGSVTVIALDNNGNTSAISAPYYLPGHPTPTLTVGPPTAVPTPPHGLPYWILLPWLARGVTR